MHTECNQNYRGTSGMEVEAVEILWNRSMEQGFHYTTIMSDGVDGLWIKRGHNSLYAIGCVVDVETGLVLDLAVFRCTANAARLRRASAEETTPNSTDSSTHTPSAIRTIVAPQEGWRSRLQRSSGIDPWNGGSGTPR